MLLYPTASRAPFVLNTNDIKSHCWTHLLFTFRYLVSSEFLGIYLLVHLQFFYFPVSSATFFCLKHYHHFHGPCNSRQPGLPASIFLSLKLIFITENVELSPFYCVNRILLLMCLKFFSDFSWHLFLWLPSAIFISRLIVCCKDTIQQWFTVYIGSIYTHTHTHLLQILSSLWFITGYSNTASSERYTTLLLIHSIYNSLDVMLENYRNLVSRSYCL